MDSDSLTTDLDVLILGAGVSGIGMAAHLEFTETGATYAILERREAVGGTWDLFRYPGIRSDSDMFTFGYGFRPWRGTQVLAAGPSIKKYVSETADEYGITQHIRFQRRAIRADWSSAEERWTVVATNEATGDSETYHSRFLVGCTGYYNYDHGYEPEFPGRDRFAGQIIHPQHWPEDLDYAGKRVVIIGSGATAVTLVPSMVDQAAHVTMLQRSPSYILPVPNTDPIAAGVKAVGGPVALSYGLGRNRNIAIQRALYDFCRKAPTAAKAAIRSITKAYLGDGVDLKHFTPSYNPWDQRLCFVPDGDLFKALRSGKASIVTDHIDTFTETGIRTKSGEDLPADIIITATGLEIQLFGGCELYVDGQTEQISDHPLYRSVMVDSVPNFVFVLGYTNQSWTLKSDLVAKYFARLYNHMSKHGYTKAVANAGPADVTSGPGKFGNLQSGYVARAAQMLPKPGSRKPWQPLDNYLIDRTSLTLAPIDDGVLELTGPHHVSPHLGGVKLPEATRDLVQLINAPRRWLSRRI